MQFRLTTETNCRALKRCMNVSYAVGHERVSSLLFQCIVPNLCGYIKCSVLIKETVYG
jgi:hypothetical protein